MALRCALVRGRAARIFVGAGVVEGSTENATLARALLAALDYRAGFQAFMISGDYDNKLLRMDKAQRLLIEPLDADNTPNPHPWYKNMLGWGRKALRITLPVPAGLGAYLVFVRRDVAGG